jgi:hypothetical protein
MAISSVYFFYWHSLNACFRISDGIRMKIIIEVCVTTKLVHAHFMNTIMPPVLYLRLGNISNKELINIIINNFEKITEAIDQQSKLIIMEKLNLLIF